MQQPKSNIQKLSKLTDKQVLENCDVITLSSSEEEDNADDSILGDNDDDSFDIDEESPIKKVKGKSSKRRPSLEKVEPKSNKKASKSAPRDVVESLEILIGSSPEVSDEDDEEDDEGDESVADESVVISSDDEDCQVTEHYKKPQKITEEVRRPSELFDVSFDDSYAEEFMKNKIEKFEVRYLTEKKKFSIRNGDALVSKIKEIADEFSLQASNVYLHFNGLKIDSKATLLSLNHQSWDFFELYYSTKQSDAPAIEEVDDSDTFKLKFNDNEKNTFTIDKLTPDMKVSELAAKIAQVRKRPLEGLKIHFDGARLIGERTLEESELEEGFQCEVTYKS